MGPKVETTQPVKGLKYDQGKPQWHLVIFTYLLGLVKVLMFGAQKYAPNSWQAVENGGERYYDALVRHLTQMMHEDGTLNLNAKDSESGLYHLWHVQANAYFLEKFRQDAELKSEGTI